jgi:hypothetical protein
MKRGLNVPSIAKRSPLAGAQVNTHTHTQFHADAAVVELVGCSKKPKQSVNGYVIIIAMQKWRLEIGYFLHQLDGYNCGPIACMKIIDHAIDVEEAWEL